MHLEVVLLAFSSIAFLLVGAYFILLRNPTNSQETKKSKNSNRRKRRKNQEFEEEKDQRDLSDLIKKLSVLEAKEAVMALLEMIPAGERSVLTGEEGEIAKKKVEIRSLESRLKNAEEELKFVVKTSRGVEESYITRIRSMEGEIERLGSVNAAMGEKHETAVEDLRRKLGDAQREEGEARGRNEWLCAEKERMERELAELKRESGREMLEEKERVIRAIQEEITATNRRFVAAANREEALRRDGGAADRMLADKLATVEGRVAQLTGEVAELTNEKQRAEAELEETMRALEAALGDVEEMKRSVCVL